MKRLFSIFMLILLLPCFAAAENAITLVTPMPSAPAGVEFSCESFIVRLPVGMQPMEEADLTGSFRISEEGTIDYPFCGRLSVSGLSQGALADRLTACLKDGYLKNPQVTVFLKEFNSQKIFVLGQVNKPGTFLFEDRMSVVQAVSLAGGFSKLAAKNSVIVTRRVDGSEQKFKLPVESIAEGRHANFTLQPGDIVYVPESFL